MPLRDRHLPRIRQAQEYLLDGRLGLYEIVRYQTRRRGRQHFPALLCLTACRSVGGREEQALPAAAGLDLAEAAFALHDSLGTGKLPFALRLWGQPQAINAGDALFSLARISLLDLEKNGARPQQVAEALHLLDEACFHGGRGRSMAFDPPDGELDAAHLMSVAQEKEGAFWGCATHMGAMLGGASGPLAARLRSFSSKLGTAHSLVESPSAVVREQVPRLYAEALADLEASVSAEYQQEMRDLATLAARSRTRTETL